MAEPSSTNLTTSHATVGLTNREIWGLVLIAHIAVAGGWWWFMPQGFPLGHNRFWVNTALPWFGILLLATGIRSGARPSGDGDAILIMMPGFWVGAGITAVMLFPASSVKMLPIFVPTTVGLSMFAWRSLKKTRAEALSFLAAASVGAFVVFSQRAPAASTRPGQTAIESPPPNLRAAEIYNEGVVSFDPTAEMISVALGHASIKCWPLLSFESRSPDRCWTCFALQQDRAGPERRLLGVQTNGAERVAFYDSDFSSRLSVNVESPKVVAVESTAQLTGPIYSHLNSCCNLHVVTPRPPFVIFSPCPDTPIAVDSPRGLDGRPIRIAYLAEDGFHVVEADKLNKGPLTHLASGPLARGEPLALTFVMEDAQLFRLELKDWSREVSTELSPTAGWGAPMNAIEFWPSWNGFSVVITLAGTSVGTGFDSVGHCEGTYRGRMLFELLD